jgi:hypothetical protein
MLVILFLCQMEFIFHQGLHDKIIIRIYVLVNARNLKQNNIVDKFLILLVSVGIFTGCKKDKDDSLPVTTENLTGKYTLTSAEGSDQRLLDQSFLPCAKDNEYELLANYVLKNYDIGTQCSSNTVSEGTWELENKIISFDTYTGTVEKLTSKTLIITNVSLIGFTFVDVKFTFARK